jgi:putative flavoprotein involved in K+ transport
MDERRPERHEALVIGGGQAGLAVSDALTRRGIQHLVLEARSRVGDQWRDRWDSLRLYSPARSDSLPGMPFPAPPSAYPSGHQMADYLGAYADERRLPIRTGVKVDGLMAVDGGGYVVTAGELRFECEQVIVATGAFQEPRIPDFATLLRTEIRQLHSRDYRRPDQLADGPVLVVGLSHSGADVAFEAAHNGHETHLSGKAHGQLPFSVESRRGRVMWRVLQFVFSHVLTLNTPLGRRAAPAVRKGGGPLLRIRMPDLLAAGVEHHPSRTTGVSDGRPVLADGTVLDVATVVWCTGFKADYSWIKLPLLGSDGWPRQYRGVADVPGMYFVGIPFQFAFSSMLILGVPRDAAYVADRVADRTRGTGTLSAARRRLKPR